MTTSGGRRERPALTASGGRRERRAEGRSAGAERRRGEGRSGSREATGTPYSKRWSTPPRRKLEAGPSG